MIVSLLAGLVMDNFGYYCVLAYCSLSLVVFMVSVWTNSELMVCSILYKCH